MTASVYAPGQRQTSEQTLTPDKENVIRLGTISHVTGTVTDAETGQPVDSFHMELGIEWNNQQQVTWQPGMMLDANPRAGHFQFDNQWNYPGIAVKITASGYLPAVSRIIGPTEGNVALDIKMKPGKDLVLKLHAPDGSAVGGATAILAGPGEQAFIQNGREPRNMGQNETYSSKADGTIDIPPQTGNFKIVILADAGYAQVDQDAVGKSPDITLSAWGKIDGTMMVGSKPASGSWVDLVSTTPNMYNQQEPMVQMQYSAQTGEDGRFSFDRVPPGEWMVLRRVQLSQNSYSNVNLETVDVKAGEDVTVTVGGKGRPVEGKVVLPAALSGRTDWTYAFCQMTSLTGPMSLRPPYPDSLKNASADERQQWVQTWMKTDEGKKYMREVQRRQMEMRNYPLAIAADGTFHEDDVEPGTYQISLNLRKSQGMNGFGDEVGEGFAMFTMPEIPGGHSDEVLHIDPISVCTLGKYNVGDVVSDMSLEASDGKPIRFSDYRGKYLLVGFFGTIDFNILRFKSIYADYGKDSRLAMMQIQPQPVPPGQTPQRVDSNPWPMGFMPWNGMGGQLLNVNFNIQAAPGAWLIGPDGKVIAEGLTGDGIRAAVVSALGPPQVPATQP